jgi:hypothetical protein
MTDKLRIPGDDFGLGCEVRVIVQLGKVLLVTRTWPAYTIDLTEAIREMIKETIDDTEPERSASGRPVGA